MERKILFTPTADEQFTALENAPSKVGLLDQSGRPSATWKSTHTIPGFIRTSFSR